MYKLLVDRAADVIWTTDLELRYTFVSPSVMRLRGYTVDEVMLQDIRESLVPASFELVRKTWAQVMERERMGLLGASWSHIIELEMRRKDGSTVPVELTVAFLRTAGGKAVGLVGTTRDITTRKQIESALRESERRYRLLAENAADVIWTADMNFRPTYISPAVTRLTGFSVEEAMALSPPEFMTPPSLEQASRALSDALGGGAKGGTMRHPGRSRWSTAARTAPRSGPR
jgi:PAS domain S-box-containing protein